MSGKSANFGDKKVNKSNFYKNKNLFKIDDIDVSKILISKKESYSKNKTPFKDFIEYNDNDVIRPLCIKLPQLSGYVKCFDTNKTMSFKVNDKKLLKRYIKIWKKISILIGKKFDSEPFYCDNNKYIKAKITRYQDHINASFQGNKMPK